MTISAKTPKKDNLFDRYAVLISTSISAPRHQRRAQMMLDAGYRVRVYAFERQENWYRKLPGNVDVIHLGNIQSGNYIFRLPTLIRGAKTIRVTESKEKIEPTLVYAFGLDAALIGVLGISRSVPLFYEVGDVRNANPDQSLLSRAIYLLESSVVRHATGVVVTSPAFLTDFYSKMDPEVSSKAVVIENKLPADYRNYANRPAFRRARQPLRLGMVGVLRYPDAMLPILSAVARRAGDYELHVYGDGELRGTVERYAQTARNIFYHGSFKNPEDLSRIYESIDVNYVVYDNRDENVRMALPNKLYESIYFGVPLVVASDTKLAQRVTELGIGFAVDPRQEGFADGLLDFLSVQAVDAAAKRALALPESAAVHDSRLVISNLLNLLP